MSKIEQFSDRCRCCLKTGHLKDMWSVFTHDGQQEIYGELLTECFAISLQPSECKDHICTACIKRLRDAYKFRILILASEEHLFNDVKQEIVPSIRVKNVSSLKFKEDIKEEVEEVSKEIECTEENVQYLFCDEVANQEQGLETVEDEEYIEESTSMQLDDDSDEDVEYLEVEFLDEGDNATEAKQEPQTKRKWPKKKKKHEKLTTYKKYPQQDLRKAMEAVKNDLMTRSEAAAYYKVPLKTLGAKIRAEESEIENPARYCEIGPKMTESARKKRCCKLVAETQRNSEPVEKEVAASSSESDENIPPREQQRDATSDESAPRKCNANPTYTISPVITDESDVDLREDDPEYVHTINDLNKKKLKNFFFQPSNSLSSNSCDSDASTTMVQRGRKRLRDTAKWKQNKAKRLRNSGKSYVSMSKIEKKVPSRCLKPPCTQKCKLKCTEKIDNDARYELFTFYWGLGDLYKQRAYIKSSMVNIKPKYQYTNAENPRKPNKAYYFTVLNEKIRVCKTFFKSTLDISDRMILTTQRKTNNNDVLEEDLRGKHSNHKKINPDLIKDIKDHINSIPRIESHYVRSTSKEYIDGGMTIKDLYNDFMEQQKQNNKEIGNYMAYYNIFTKDLNISFFQPKKDMCDFCLAYENSTADQKMELTENYNKHLDEKKLSREEKKTDRKNITENTKVVIYDLQAVLQCPRGDSSEFYYKSKLNSYNLTVTELTKSHTKKGACEHVHCYFWTESDAKRGAIEIGTCVWKYLEEVSKDAEDPLNVIFYSDNWAGQNKNKYIMTMYMYAVYLFNIQSITHKFLIRGHTRNEADNVHSLIEKEVKKNLKSGPIYTPVEYITLIKNSKKSNPPINVHELTFQSFLDWKLLQEEWGFNFSTDESGQKINWNDVKVLKVTKENPFMFYFRTSYQEKIYKEVNVRNKRRKMKPASEISLNKAYTQRQKLSSKKKKDLKELIKKALIPSYYASFYNSIF